MGERKDLGLWGEEVIAKFLKRQGFVILARNFVSRFGEIDIIAKREEQLLFVEVKTRKVALSYDTLPFPVLYVITKSKQQKIIRTARYFLFKNQIDDCACRFDVATVLIREGEKEKIEYVENAFE